MAFSKRSRSVRQGHLQRSRQNVFNPRSGARVPQAAFPVALTTAGGGADGRHAGSDVRGAATGGAADAVTAATPLGLWKFEEATPLERWRSGRPGIAGRDGAILILLSGASRTAVSRLADSGRRLQGVASSAILSAIDPRYPVPVQLFSGG
jgi:hypothetical protein